MFIELQELDDPGASLSSQPWFSVRFSPPHIYFPALVFSPLSLTSFFTHFLSLHCLKILLYLDSSLAVLLGRDDHHSLSLLSLSLFPCWKRNNAKKEHPLSWSSPRLLGSLLACRFRNRRRFDHCECLYFSFQHGRFLFLPLSCHFFTFFLSLPLLPSLTHFFCSFSSHSILLSHVSLQPLRLHPRDRLPPCPLQSARGWDDGGRRRRERENWRRV